MAEEVQHPAADPGGNGGVSSGDGPKGSEQLGWPHILEQKTTGTGPEGREGILVEIKRREDNDPRLRALLDNAPGRRNPIRAGHSHIHQHDVRCQSSTHVDATAAVGGLTGDFHAVLGFQDHAEARPDECLVIN